MRSKWAARRLVIVALVMWLLPQAAFAEAVTLRLTPKQQQYLPYEPVLIEIAILNDGTEDFNVWNDVSLQAQTVSFDVRNPRGQWTQVHACLITESITGLIPVPPGESFLKDQLLFFDCEGVLHSFNQPGAYSVKATYHRFGDAPDIESELVGINVVAPAKVDGEAAELFKTTDVTNLVLVLTQDATAVANLERIIETKTGSRFASYARYYLARRATQRYFERQPNYQAAVDYLTTGLAEGRASQMEAPRLRLLGESYERLSQAPRATQAYRSLVSRYPQSADARAVSGRLERLGGTTEPSAPAEGRQPDSPQRKKGGRR